MQSVPSKSIIQLCLSGLSRSRSPNQSSKRTAPPPLNSSVSAHMKRSFQLMVLTVLASLVCSCNLFDSGISWHSGRFQVEWVDTAPSSHLAYRLQSGDSLGIVEACVLAAGSDKRYVVVEQRPLQQPSVQLYYVLSTAGFNPLYPKQQLRGPLDLPAYDVLAKQLSLPSLQRVVPQSTCSASAR